MEKACLLKEDIKDIVWVDCLKSYYQFGKSNDVEKIVRAGG